MSETWFDTDTGSVFTVLGAEAQARPDFPINALPLHQLLLANDEDFTYKHGDFEPIYGSRSHLSAEKKLELGRWAVEVLAESGKPVPLHYNPHINRLHILGLVPLKKAFTHHFPNFREFREQIGSPLDEEGEYSIYSGWTTAQFVSHGARLAKQLGRRPNGKDFDRYKGPSAALIHDRIGGIGKLNAMNGWFEARLLSDEDFVDWGVEYIEVNGIDLLVPQAIKIVSTRDAGPSLSAINSRFRTWSNFKQEIIGQKVTQNIDEAERVATKLSEYRELIAKGKLPKEYSDCTDDKLLIRGACYSLITDNAQLMPQERKLRLVREGPGQLIQNLGAYNPRLTAGVIETSALALGVFDDLWPIARASRERMRITSEDRELMRIRNRNSNMRQHRSKKSGTEQAA